MKKIYDSLIVTDATKGDILLVLEFNKFSCDTIGNILRDLLYENIDNGIYVKLGIKP